MHTQSRHFLPLSFSWNHVSVLNDSLWGTIHVWGISCVLVISERHDSPRVARTQAIFSLSAWEGVCVCVCLHNVYLHMNVSDASALGGHVAGWWKGLITFHPPVSCYSQWWSSCCTKRALHIPMRVCVTGCVFSLLWMAGCSLRWCDARSWQTSSLLFALGSCKQGKQHFHKTT